MNTSLIETVEKGLATSHDGTIVRELLQAYVETKRNFYLGSLRLSEVEGGRFCEAAFRILEERTKRSFTPFNKKVDVEKLRRELEQFPVNSHPDAIRLHIPRALRVVYDIRNNRDAAHLADEIDPNLQDATFVVSILDWVLAEFVRIYHTVSPNEAQQIVDSLMTRRAPAVQDFDGFLKVLRTNLQASDHVLLLLYQRGSEGATFEELRLWSRPKMRTHLKRTLDQLTNKRTLVHFDEKRYYVTQTGVREVEQRKLYVMPD